MTKKVKKGFTLLELIVVMAIFSILMVGVMSLITPVSNMFKSAAMSEKTYSYANNIQQYLQTKLEYAEDVYIGSSDKLGLTEDGKANDAKIATLVEKFRNSHFKNVVKTSDGGDHLEYVNGKIHVIRLVNKNGTLNTDEDVQKGQITHRVYDFNSKDSETIKSDVAVVEVAELNPAFLGANDAAYDFSYALGAGNLLAKDRAAMTPVTAGTLKSNENYKVLDTDYNNKKIEASSARLSLSIILNKRTNGSVECKANDLSGEYIYRAFAGPSSIQIVNLPLTNIAYRNTTGDDEGIGLLRPYDDGTGVKIQTPALAGKACDITGLSDNINFDEDIYFIYCFTDEIES